MNHIYYQKKYDEIRSNFASMNRSRSNLGSSSYFDNSTAMSNSNLSITKDTKGYYSTKGTTKANYSTKDTIKGNYSTKGTIKDYHSTKSFVISPGGKRKKKEMNLPEIDVNKEYNKFKFECKHK